VYAPAVTDISETAFSGCQGLTSASFPAVTSIGSNAFDLVDNMPPLTLTLGPTPPVLQPSALPPNDPLLFVWGALTPHKTITIKVPSVAAYTGGSVAP